MRPGVESVGGAFCGVCGKMPPGPSVPGLCHSDFRPNAAHCTTPEAKRESEKFGRRRFLWTVFVDRGKRGSPLRGTRNTLRKRVFETPNGRRGRESHRGRGGEMQPAVLFVPCVLFVLPGPVRGETIARSPFRDRVRGSCRGNRAGEALSWIFVKRSAFVSAAGRSPSGEQAERGTRPSLLEAAGRVPPGKRAQRAAPRPQFRDRGARGISPAKTMLAAAAAAGR